MSSKWKLIAEEAARKVYEHQDGQTVLLVAGDEMPDFDEKLGVTIPGKGRMLTKMSKYWFDQTESMVPNAYAATKFGSVDKNSYLELELNSETVTPMLKLDMLPIEAIVRGYIAGDMWASYAEGFKDFCGITLGKHLKNGERLTEPIFTPVAKSSDGELDQNLSFDEMIGWLESRGVMGAADRTKLIREYSIKLYNLAHDRLLKKGIILADARFEFGINPLTGNIMLGSELFTSDSSSFWSLKDYEIGKEQKSLDKQIIRDWVVEHPDERVTKAVLEKAAIVYSRLSDAVVDEKYARTFF